MNEPKFIDVEKILREKRPGLAKWLPKFIIRYIKRILHQDEINAFLVEHKDKKNAAFCQEVLDYFNIKVSMENLDRIPKNGKITIAMNHPLGGMDAIILVTALQGHREDIKFIVNDILMNLDNMKDLFLGVNKIGKNAVSTRTRIAELFKSDQAVCIFPAGLVSRKKRGKVRDLVWKKTFVTYAKEEDRTIIPLFIEGRLSNFFYRLSNFRKFIGIKANIEMLYLSNELFKQRDRHMRFVVGEPVTKELLFSTEDDRALAQDIKAMVYQLEN